jgi:ComF family protein
VCAQCADGISRTGSDAEQKGDFFSVCVSPLYYDGTVRESILRYKFKEATGYAKTYGVLIADCVRERLENRYDLISWVPLSRERYKERGYDQAMLLAMAVALELDDVAVSTLEKYKHVAKQSQMGSAEKRRANISGVYRVTDPELIADKRILLIDDIITTGSTLSECARTLLEGGAKEVLCATIARSRD